MMRTLSYASLVLVLAAGASLLGGCTLTQELRLHPLLAMANEAFENKDYALAAARYESLSDRYPNTLRRQEMIIRQGISLYTVESYHDARDVFLGYLKEFPDGHYTRDARAYITKVDVLMSNDSPAKREVIEAAKKDLNQLQQLRMAHPHDPAVVYAIGNLYYEIKNYDEAVRAYYDALTMDAAYKEKKLIRERMVLDNNGKPQPLTPAEMRLIEKENRPLVVFDKHDYKASDQDVLSNGQKRFYNVTGLIRNQSSRLMQDVQVEVTFLNTQNQIQDTQLVVIGSMGPGEIRPWRAVSDSYDNLYNITSYECVPRWER